MSITNQEIDVIVKESGARFLHQKECVANRPNMTEMVDRLEEYTDEVQEAADEHGVTTDVNMMQWNRDMTNWLLRIARYRHSLQNAKYETGPESCEELRAPVNEPLLVGWYPMGMPGIANPKVQTVADVATPFMLGNQVVVYREHQSDRLWQFLKDLNPFLEETRAGMLDYWCEKTGTCGPGGWGSGCDAACWMRRTAIGVGVVGAGYLAVMGVRWVLGRRTQVVIAQDVAP